MKIPKYLLEKVPAREGGTYVVATRCQHWGRGATLAEALEQARKAGARKFGAGNVAVFWQVNSAWEAVKVENPHAQAPFVNDFGSLASYGQPLPEQLVRAS